MLDTPKEMYMTFLDGIRKSSTGTVTPGVWNRLVNEWGQNDWVKDNLSAKEGSEKTQKQQEDLHMLRVVTDGIDNYGGVLLVPIAHIVGNAYRFKLPIPDPTVSAYLVSIFGVNYPKMFRLLNIEFKINYVGNDCNSGVSDWLSADIMRSDQRTANKHNPFRKPTDERLYYDMKHNYADLYTGTASTGHSMKIEYYRYPIEINYDPLVPANDVYCEFGETQRKEIIDLCVRQYLERATDPRYQSFLQEETIRTITKQ